MTLHILTDNSTSVAILSLAVVADLAVLVDCFTNLLERRRVRRARARRGPVGRHERKGA